MCIADFSNPPGLSVFQEFIDKPLVIDNKKLEVGIYATVLSVNPLRVYINEGDWYLRYVRYGKVEASNYYLNYST